MTAYTYEEIAEYISDTHWIDAGYQPHKFNVAPGGTVTVSYTSLSTAGQQYASTALQIWSDVTGINFQTTNPVAADILFSDAESASGAHTVVSWNAGNGDTISADVIIPDSWIFAYTGTGYEVDSESLSTYVHEVGHALGLGHAGPYDGNAHFDLDYSDGDVHTNGAGENIYDNDSYQATIMSYFSQTENTVIGATGASFAIPITPQIADIIAIQDMYGVPATTRAGNTTYGYNSNAGGIWDSLTTVTNAVTFTVFDSGGIDTIDLSGYVGEQHLNLRPGTISDIFGQVGTAMIATNTIIENAIGGSGEDLIIGNSANNILAGMRGLDSLRGGNGDDLLTGGIGRDWIWGGNGHDTIRGGGGNDNLQGKDGDDGIWGANGNDRITGGLGNDALIGGAGADTFVFLAEDILAGGNDEIRDFEDGIDVIEIQGYAEIDASLVGAIDGPYTITIGVEIILLTLNGTGELTFADDFIFV